MESSTSDSEESTDSSSRDWSSEDDKKEKRKTKKSGKDRKSSKDRSKKSKKEKQGNRKKRNGEQKPAATPTKESNVEEKRELRARLEAEQLRARMWQELSEANSLAEEGSQQKTTTPRRRGARTPLTSQTTKKSEEDEGRGMNVADALRRAGENNGQDDSETQRADRRQRHRQRQELVMAVIFATGIVTGAATSVVMVSGDTERLPGPAVSVKRVVTACKTLWWDEARTVSLLEHWTGLPVLHPEGSAWAMSLLASAPLLLMELRRYGWQQALAWTTAPTQRLTDESR